jgi:hypothetical protein
MEICGQKFTEKILARIDALIALGITRVKLSREVCEWLNWRGANGKLKEVSCRMALRRLEGHGLLKLPEAGKIPRKDVKKDKLVLKKDVTQVERIEGSLSDLGGIEFIKIKSKSSLAAKIWNELMDKYHYLGSGPMCGGRMRYLLKSRKYGWVGGLAFSSAAWKLKARDQWIGWSAEERERQRDKVVCNSRFLILPQVKVKNLASHVLAKSIKRLRIDWAKRYGYEPALLETFVESSRFQGTSYRAANWKDIGRTQGRGRNDRLNEKKAGIKAVYIYPLRNNAREILCEGRREAAWEAKAPIDWAEEEFGGARLGERRLEKRLMTIARDFYARPQANIPQACQSRAKTKAAYRFFENQKVNMEKILTSHRAATVKRMAHEAVVLAVQDTTTLNYSSHPATEGLGLIGYRENGGVGLIVHDTLAFDMKGTPLGLLDVQCWKRDPQDYGKKHLRKKREITEKESHKWLKSYQQASAAQWQCPQTKIVSVGDREADIYELFALAVGKEKGAKLLVRAEQNRLLAEGQEKLWERVSRQAVSGKHHVWVGRRGNQAGREAELEIRFARVSLQPPQKKKALGELVIYAVLARENPSAKTGNPLEWMLLSTDPVRTVEEAVEKLEWYSQRWGIEIYHKTLKSGCQIERRQVASTDGLETCLAVDMVIAWRILHLTRLGRKTPDLPCTLFFEEAEYKALMMYKTKNATPPAKVLNLREAIHMVASLGGFLGRKGDGEPGTKSLWLGLQRLEDITAAWKIMASCLAPQLLEPSASSIRYG